MLTSRHLSASSGLILTASSARQIRAPTTAWEEIVSDYLLGAVRSELLLLVPSVPAFLGRDSFSLQNWWGENLRGVEKLLRVPMSDTGLEVRNMANGFKEGI